MIPVEFKECNTVYAKDQPEYLPLPVYKADNGKVISCWQMNFIERIKALITGKVYLKILTFNHPLQPLKMSISKEAME